MKNTKKKKNSITKKRNIFPLILLSVIGISVLILVGFKFFKKETKVDKVYKILVTNVDGTHINYGISSVLKDLDDHQYPARIFAGKEFSFGTSSSILYLISSKSLKQFDNKIIEGAKVKILGEEPKIMPYLRNSKYCINDSDCTENSHYCQIGSYNSYTQMFIYGCGYTTGVEGFTSDELNKVIKDCPLINGNHSFSAEFTQSRCISNQCKAIDMRISCIKK